MLESQSRALKTRNQKYWRIGSDDDVIKSTKKHTSAMIPVAQNPPPIFFYSKLHDATSQYRV